MLINGNEIKSKKDLEKLKVEELKSALIEKGLEAKGVKSVLIDALWISIESEVKQSNATVSSTTASPSKKKKREDVKEEEPPTASSPLKKKQKIDELVAGTEVKVEREDEKEKEKAKAKEKEIEKEKLKEKEKKEVKFKEEIKVETIPSPHAGSKRKFDNINNNNVKMEDIIEEEEEEEKERMDNMVKKERVKCPYLDTIKRSLLDFDLAKECSISLLPTNVYCCLVCGVYFNGRGRHTHAYTHSLQHHHHVFVNLGTKKFYCLPDLYEIVDSALDDIREALHPTFSKEYIASIDTMDTLARNTNGIAYLPGYIGLNDIGKSDFINVVIHTLAHVTPLRDFFLLRSNYENCKDSVVQSFGEFLCKVWSPHNFKAFVAAYEFVDICSEASGRKFMIGKQSEAIDFLSWLLNALHKGLGGNRKKNSSIINQCFQGEVEVTTTVKKRIKKVIRDEENGMEVEEEDKKEDEEIEDEETIKRKYEFITTTTIVPCLYLSLELPPTPLFKDSAGGNVIPQVPIMNVLTKFDGVTTVNDPKKGEVRKYRLLKAPKYIIFHLKRFTKNNFFLEKNPTIVNFPVKNLELKDIIVSQDDGKTPSRADFEAMSISTLRQQLIKRKVDITNVVEKGELVEKALECVNSGSKSTKYNLLSNIVHDSPQGKGKEGSMDPLTGGTYRVHVKHKSTDRWYQIQDLHVAEILPQVIGLSESYCMIYERKD